MKNQYKLLLIKENKELAFQIYNYQYLEVVDEDDSKVIRYYGQLHTKDDLKLFAGFSTAWLIKKTGDKLELLETFEDFQIQSIKKQPGKREVVFRASRRLND
jgi:hypothetical protein